MRGGGGTSNTHKGLPSWQSRMYAWYRDGARRRDIAFDLTIYELGGLALLDCTYCGAPPAERKFGPVCYGVVNGIDRVDNSLGYSKVNSVPCCALCNRMKMTLNGDQFVAHAQRIAQHAER